MKTPEQIRDMEFQKSPMGGYKQSDVELFLEEVASQIEILMKQKAESDRKLQEFSKKAPEAALSASGIQNVLISAQRVADQITEDAKSAAERTVAEANLKLTEADIKAREVIADAESKAVMLGETAQTEAAKIIAEAVKEAQAIVAEAKESVQLEQKLFDRMKIEVADFRKKAAAQCSALVELINQLPGEIPFNMERSKTVLSVDFSDPEQLLKTAVEERLEKERLEADAKVKAEAPVEIKTPEAPVTEPVVAPVSISVSKEVEASVAKPEVTVMPEAEPVITTDAEFAEDIQLSFDNKAAVQPEPEAEENTEEEIPFAAAAKPEAPIKPNGHISFGDDDDDFDDDEDDEPRLFFRRKKK